MKTVASKIFLFLILLSCTNLIAASKNATLQEQKSKNNVLTSGQNETNRTCCKCIEVTSSGGVHEAVGLKTFLGKYSLRNETYKGKVWYSKNG